MCKSLKYANQTKDEGKWSECCSFRAYTETAAWSRFPAKIVSPRFQPVGFCILKSSGTTVVWYRTQCHAAQNTLRHSAHWGNFRYHCWNVGHLLNYRMDIHAGRERWGVFVEFCMLAGCLYQIENRNFANAPSLFYFANSFIWQRTVIWI